MLYRLCRFTALAALLPFLCVAKSPDSWSVAHTPHFDIYTHSHQTAQLPGAADWLEELASGLPICTAPAPGNPIRVIAFDSPADYRQYQLQPNADAYFVGTDARDYIVLPGLNQADYRTAAHEYVHFALKSCGKHVRCGWRKA